MSVLRWFTLNERTIFANNLITFLNVPDFGLRTHFAQYSLHLVVRMSGYVSLNGSAQYLSFV